jgi:hypothetical protein
MKYMKFTTERVKMVAERLPTQFGIVIDGWKEVSIHYIAIFASYSDIEGACHYPLLKWWTI